MREAINPIWMGISWQLDPVVLQNPVPLLPLSCLIKPHFPHASSSLLLYPSFFPLPNPLQFKTRIIFFLISYFLLNVVVMCLTLTIFFGI